MLSRCPPHARIAGSRTAHANKCAHAQRPAQDRWCATQSKREDRYSLIKFVWLKKRKNLLQKKRRSPKPLRNQRKKSPVKKLRRKKPRLPVKKPKPNRRKPPRQSRLPRRQLPNFWVSPLMRRRSSRRSTQKILSPASQTFWPHSTTRKSRLPTITEI